MKVVIVAAFAGALAGAVPCVCRAGGQRGRSQSRQQWWIRIGPCRLVDERLPAAGLRLRRRRLICSRRSNSFKGGAIESLGFLSQGLTIVAGTAYNIDLWLASDGFFENEFRVLWNGQVVYDKTNIFPQGFAQIVIDPIASGAFSMLSFGFRDDSGFLHIDDVSVRAVAAIPEPSQLALIAVGLGFLAGAARRQRHAR